MNRGFLVVFVVGVFLGGCNLNEEKMDQLQYKIDSLDAVIEDQNKIISHLKQTDQHKYSEATKYFNNGEYTIALDHYQRFLNSYPNSELVENVNNKIKAIDIQEETFYNMVLSNISSGTLKEKIQALNEYLKMNHSEKYQQLATSKLLSYQKKYEKIKDQLIVEEEIGIKLISSSSKWEWSGTFGSKLLVAKLKLKFKNVSESAIPKLEVKANFVNIDKKEVFGDGLTYVIGYSDAPLQPGYSKTAFIESSVGYTNDLAALSFPNLVADIYVNDKFYKKVAISKMYAGQDWGKK